MERLRSYLSLALLSLFLSLVSTQVPDYENVEAYFSNWESNELATKLYPFGPDFFDESDTGLSAPSHDFGITFAIPFYGRNYNSAYVNLHGHVSFGGSSHYLVDTPLPNQRYGGENEDDFPMVAAYYAEHAPETGTFFHWRRINPSNDIGTRQEISQRMLDDFRDDIRQRIMGAQDFEPQYAIVATWHNVRSNLICGTSSSPDCPLNTYQVVIVTDESRTFTITRYAKLEWENSFREGCDTEDGTSNNSPNCFPAQVGFNAGMARGFTPFPYSNSPNVLQLVTVADGFFVHEVTTNQVRHGNCLQESEMNEDTHWDVEMYPMDAHMFGGQELHFSGRCLSSTEAPRCRFVTDTVENEVMGKYVDEMRGSCMVPKLYRTGSVPVFVYMPGSTTASVKYIHVEPPHKSRYRVELNNDLGDWHDKQPREALKITWDPTIFEPMLYEVDNNANNANPNQLQMMELDITLFGYREKNGMAELEMLKKLSERVQNTGEFSFDPNAHNCAMNDCDWDVGSIQVSIAATQPEEVNRDEVHPGDIDGSDTEAVTTADPTNTTVTDTPANTSAPERPVRSTDNQETTVTFSRGIWSPAFHLAWYVDEQRTSEMGEDWTDQKCQSWHDTNGDMNWKSELTPCPCLYNQGLIESGRYILQDVCDDNEQCLYKCIVSVFPSASGAASKCCFKKSDDQLTYAGDTDGQSFAQRYHHEGIYPYMNVGKIPGFSHFLNDKMGHLWCCRWSEDPNNCLYKYGARRPTPDCVNHQQPGIGVAYGDPHFRTFDGKEYTFNPKGEFFLLLADSPNEQTFSMQIRMEQVMLEEGVQYMGTMITAVAMQATYTTESRGPLVEVRLNVNEPLNTLSVYIDGVPRDYGTEGISTMQFLGPNDDMMVKVTKTNMDSGIHNFTMMFQNGIGVSVAESNRRGLHIITVVPPEYHGKTSGLLGLWNGNMDDDLTPRNGDPAVTSGDNADIHNNFGMTWLVGKDESRFTYVAAMIYDYFNDAAFQPNYEPVLPDGVTEVTEQEVNSFCGDNYACRFDYMTMLNRDIAAASLSMQQYGMEINELRAIVPTCGRIDIPWSDRQVDGYMVDDMVQVRGCVDGYVYDGNADVYTCIAQDGAAKWNPEPRAECSAGGGGSNAAAIAVPIIIILLIILILVALFMIYKRRQAEREAETNGHVKKTPEDPARSQPRNVSTHPDPYANINEGLSQSTSSVGSVVLTEEIKASRPPRPKKVKHNLKPDQNGTQHYDNRAANLDENRPEDPNAPAHQPPYHPQYDPNPQYDQTPNSQYYANTPQYGQVQPPGARTPEPFPETQKGYDNPAVAGDNPAMNDSTYTTPMRHPGGRYTSSVDTTV